MSARQKLPLAGMQPLIAVPANPWMPLKADLSGAVRLSPPGDGIV